MHPDSVVQVGGKTFYWEHLGILDRVDYAKKWAERRLAYETAGLTASLLTTDDVHGVRQESIASVIEHLVGMKLEGEACAFSQHHYRL